MKFVVSIPFGVFPKQFTALCDFIEVSPFHISPYEQVSSNIYLDYKNKCIDLNLQIISIQSILDNTHYQLAYPTFGLYEHLNLIKNIAVWLGAKIIFVQSPKK